MNPLTIIKAALDITVSVGVGSIVGNAIKAGTPASTHVLKRAAIGVGGFFLSSMVSDKVSTYATDQVDKVVDNIKKVVNPETQETQDEPELTK